MKAIEALQDPWITKYADKQNCDMPTLAKSLNNMRNFRVRDLFGKA